MRLAAALLLAAARAHERLAVHRPVKTAGHERRQGQQRQRHTGKGSTRAVVAYDALLQPASAPTNKPVLAGPTQSQTRAGP